MPDLYWLVNDIDLSSVDTTERQTHKVTKTMGKDRVTSILEFGPVRRKHVNARITCLASNTNLTGPVEATATLNINCKSIM